MNPNRIKLTKTVVSAILPPPSGYSQLWDSELPGFGVRTTSNGIKSFVLQRRINGRESRFTLGRFGPITVELARRLAQTKIGEIAQGRNPVAETRTRIAAERRAAVEKDLTLGCLLDIYCNYLLKRGAVSAKSVRDDLTRNITLANPKLARRAASAVTSSDIAAAMRALSDAGKHRAAGKVRSYLAAAYSLAIGAESNSDAPAGLIAFKLQANPVAGIKAPKIKERHRWLSELEVKECFRRLNNDTSAAAELIRCSFLLGGQRPTQLARARTSDFDANSSTLTLRDPKGRRQQPREHVLPVVGKAALRILDLAALAASRKSAFLFSATGKSCVRLDDASERIAAISKAMVESGVADVPFRLSDLRRTAETMLASFKVDKDTRAQLLSHGLGGVQGQRYDRYEYMEEKRDALCLWDLKLSEIMAAKE